MKPYWESDDGMIQVFHARTGDAGPAHAHLPDILPTLDVKRVALVHADPPYGVREATDRKASGRGRGSRGSKAKAKSHDFPAVVGDDGPYNPSDLLGMGRPTVLWGANHYAPRVPESPSWIVWDKREGVLVNDNADCEVAWSNLGGPARVFRHLWAGMLRASEKGDTSMAPTQKPIALCSWVYQRAKLKPGDLVFVPYGGSGPDLPACRAAGLRCVWVECERAYCDIAISRLGAVTSERAAEPVGPLFVGGLTR